ncbi:MAG: thioesterase [Bacteroidetes bacterium]|nr:thioesterase [Bacteroidota bacterium]MCL1969256.1 thioesterase [Bacteroidota bacterium]
MYINNVYSREFHICGYDVDHNCRITIDKLLCMMHETAWSHVTHLKRGWQELQAEGLFWALAKLHLKIHKLPKWNDKIRIETWAKERESIMFMRDYEVFDETGELLCCAISEWMLVDYRLNKIVRLERLNTHLDYPKDRVAFEGRVPRLPRVEFPENSHFHTVVLSDLDMNQHVNNASYVRWVVDRFSYEQYNQLQIKELIINYVNQLKAGERYCIAMQETSPAHFNATLYGEDGKEVCKVLVIGAV